MIVKKFYYKILFILLFLIFKNVFYNNI